MTVHRRPTGQPAVHITGNQCLISLFLAIDSSLGAQVQPDIAHPCCDQLTAVKTGSGVDPQRSSIFFKLSADKLLVFKIMIASPKFFFLKNAWEISCVYQCIMYYQWITQNTTLNKSIAFSPLICLGLIDNISDLLLRLHNPKKHLFLFIV